MEIEVFTLCDAATVWMGKLNIVGCLDQITALQFPAVHPACAIGLRIRFERIEEGTHKIKINFVNADGKAVIPAFNTEAGVWFAGDEQWRCVNIAYSICQLKLQSPGHYSLDLAIDGRHERSLPLRAIKRRLSGLAVVPDKPH
jgi:hypothetical protein